MTPEKTDPLVSVVVPAYNCATYLADALNSVLEQTFESREIIVVDDGSTDRTPEVAGQFQDQIRYVRQSNSGANAARNHGVRLARGPYIALLDADDMWVPQKLSLQVAAMEHEPGFGAVHTDSIRVTEANRVLDDTGPRRKQSSNGWVFDEFFDQNMSVILTSTVLIRRTCFETTGLFDESGQVVDDHDFFLRLAWAYPICYLPQPLVRYRVIRHSLSRQNAVTRMEQHRETIARCIAAHREYFETEPDRIRQRWRRFYLWAGTMLYHHGAGKHCRRYLRKAFPFGPRTCALYAASCLPLPVQRVARRVAFWRPSPRNPS
jgi:glycosyltransferase involved in cell wall biosynthesis